MDKISISINGKISSVQANITILAASRLMGIYIPTLCSHPDLPPAALEMPKERVYQGGTIINNALPLKAAKKCGLCIVKVTGRNDLLNSCVTRIAEGMEIVTDNALIREERRKNLVPILSRHQHACLTCAQQEGCSQTQCSANVAEHERCCSKFANCELRNVVNFIGIPESTPKWVSSNLPVIEDLPLFKTNYNLCIGCTRCVRICNDIREVGAIGFAWDNEQKLQIGTINKGLEESGCKFCTACVEVCPTGALQDKYLKYGQKEESLVPCKTACPVNMNIPLYLKMISMGKIEEAQNIIRDKVPFPSTLGRICMHPCEDVCRRQEVNEPVSICALKRFASDKKYNKLKKTEIQHQKVPKKVDIIGSGPMGLTTAFYLRKKGYNVTIYDEKKHPGGMLRYGIPRYRLPIEILNNEIKEILDLGIDFKSKSKFGRDFTLSDLKKEGTDAILIALGAQKDKTVPLEGSDLEGVLGSIDFLRIIHDNSHSQVKIGNITVVIGGGNVAIDAAMTAKRCGAEVVTMVCLEEEKKMPANTWEIETAKLEGITILPSWAPKRIIGENGQVNKIEIMKCTRVFDDNGSFNPQCDYQTTKYISADQIIMAVGQEADLTSLDSENIHTSEGFIIVNEKTLETTMPGVYAGGDVVSLPGSVIKAIASGRKAAEEIDKALGGTGIINDESPSHSSLSINKALGKNVDFSKWKREQEAVLNVQKRSSSFEEIVLGFTEKQAIKEGSRCLQCNLRLEVDSNPSPPSEKRLPLTDKIINNALLNETEGVYKLFDEKGNITAIVGTNTLRNDLLNEANKNTADFFEFEEDKMYSKRESELLQKHLQEYGSMPGNNDEMDDLF